MAGTHPHGMRAPDESAHRLIQHAIKRGFLDSGKPFLLPGLPDHASANDARVSVARGLEHFNLGRAAWVTDADGNQCYRDCKDPSAPHGIGFQLHSKNKARQHVAQRDPSEVKFNPFLRRQSPRFDDNGQQMQGM